LFIKLLNIYFVNNERCNHGEQATPKHIRECHGEGVSPHDSEIGEIVSGVTGKSKEKGLEGDGLVADFLSKAWDDKEDKKDAQVEKIKGDGSPHIWSGSHEMRD